MEKILKLFSSILFTNIKFLLAKFLGNHVEFKAIHMISPLVSVQAWGNNARIKLGSKVHIRANTELRSSDGRLDIGDQVFINRNCVVCAREQITIADGVTIGPNTCIYDHDHSGDGGYVTSPVKIQEGAWIGANVSILKGVTIGKNAVVAAGAVVTKNVPESVVVAGIPAKIIRG